MKHNYPLCTYRPSPLKIVYCFNYVLNRYLFFIRRHSNNTGTVTCRVNKGLANLSLIRLGKRWTWFWVSCNKVAVAEAAAGTRILTQIT